MKSPKRSARTLHPATGLSPKEIAAVSAVEGLKLGKESKERLRALAGDASLTPADRRAAVLKAYTGLSKKR